MAGLLEGFIAGAAGFGAKQIERSIMADMQEERDARLAELQKERDQRLSDQEEGRQIRKEERSVKRMKDIGEEADKAGSAKTEDAAGNAMDQSPSEKAESRAKVFTKHGLIEEARKERDTESTRQYREEQGVRENRRLGIEQERLTSQERHQAATERYQSGMLALQKQTADMDKAIKQFTVDNNKRVEDLRKEFLAKDTTPERKHKINEELSILTGKDNDKYLPVPLKDDMGNITGYQIFDTKRGEFVSQKGGPSAKGAPAVGTVIRGSDGIEYEFSGGNPQDKGAWKPRANPGGGSRTPSPAPNSDSGVSAYGPLTSWDTVEEQVRNGDRAAINYATRRIAGGPGIMGVEPPKSLVDYLNSLSASGNQ